MLKSRENCRFSFRYKPLWPSRTSLRRMARKGMKESCEKVSVNASGERKAVRRVKNDWHKLAYFPGSAGRRREAEYAQRNKVTVLLIGSLIIKMLKTYFSPFSFAPFFGCLTTNKKRELFMSYVITSWSRFSAINYKYFLVVAPCFVTIDAWRDDATVRNGLREGFEMARGSCG